MNFLSCYWTLSCNFGDLIGPWLLEKITGKKVIYAGPSSDYQHYVFGGSLLNHVNDRAIVWGAGLGTLTDGVNTGARIHAVRGPYTRARALSLGVHCPAVYGDPGMLLPKFHKPALPRDRKIGVIPHYVDQYRAYSRYESLHVIDVFRSIESVVDEICSCERVFSSSLHGIIIAHAYGIPAVWVKMSDSLGGDGTKFRDYFASVGMDVTQPIDVREKAIIPTIPDEVPKINTDAFWNACPVNQEWRKPEYRT